MVRRMRHRTLFLLHHKGTVSAAPTLPTPNSERCTKKSALIRYRGESGRKECVRYLKLRRDIGWKILTRFHKCISSGHPSLHLLKNSRSWTEFLSTRTAKSTPSSRWWNDKVIARDTVNNNKQEVSNCRLPIYFPLDNEYWHLRIRTRQPVNWLRNAYIIMGSPPPRITQRGMIQYWHSSSSYSPETLLCKREKKKKTETERIKIYVPLYSNAKHYCKMP